MDWEILRVCDFRDWIGLKNVLCFCASTGIARSTKSGSSTVEIRHSFIFFQNIYGKGPLPHLFRHWGGGGGGTTHQSSHIWFPNKKKLISNVPLIFSHVSAKMIEFFYCYLASPKIELSYVGLPHGIRRGPWPMTVSQHSKSEGWHPSPLSPPPSSLFWTVIRV